MTKPRFPKAKFVSASDLAQMGVCERLMYFEHLHGRQRTPEQQCAAAQGDATHAQFHRDALYADQDAEFQKSKPWCFIASAAFTPMAPETQTLRRFRDEVLRPAPIGRAFIRTYYRLSPPIAGLIRRHPRLRVLAAWCLRPCVWMAAAFCRRWA